MLSLLIWNCDQPTKARARPPVPENEKTAAPSAWADSASGGIVLDLNAMAQNGELPASDTVQISYDNHFNKNNKRYMGFPLEELLDAVVFKRFAFDTTDAIVHFECTDGYRPTMPVSLVFGQNAGYLVHRDLEAPPGRAWADSLEEARFKPFYLVWDGTQPGDHRFMWPYGLIRIKLVSLRREFKNAYPFKNPEMAAGFNLFNQNCMKCHAINGVGGVMGPEFNYPKNITEYWTEANIMAFARNPQSFRISSKMAPVQGLTDAEFKSIIGYLRFMAKRKALE